jgi:hypothetical protein
MYYGDPVEIEDTKDPIIEYINKNKDQLLRSYTSDKNMSENIESLFYNKKDYTAFMKNDKNEIETAWKTRILYENTPKGSIIMFYDAYKQGFTYYTDQTSMPITILNAVAMKYVIRFFCRDFYYDEDTLKCDKVSDENDADNEIDEDTEKVFIENVYISPLIKIHNDDEDKKKKELKNILHNAPFARLKSNKKMKEEEEIKKEKKPMKEQSVNRFVSLGKIYNFHILQKKHTQASTNTSYDDMFNTSKASIISTKMSYKDFKRTKQD